MRTRRARTVKRAATRARRSPSGRRRTSRTTAPLLAALPAPIPAVPHTDKPPGRGTWRRASYRGRAGGRSYAVYVPPGLRRGSAVPLLVALHGCGQTRVDFAAATRFNQLADRHRFVVVYPEQSSAAHGHRCWNWFEPSHQHRSVGEPAIIAGIVRQVLAEPSRWTIDRHRVYVVGLSAGGAMALVLAATYPELFAGIGVHSAPAYRSATDRRAALSAMAGRTVVPPPHGGPAMPPAVVVQGTGDATVWAVNADRVGQQWLAFRRAASDGAGDPDPDRVTRSATSRTARSGRRRSATVTRWYTARGRKCLEVWRIDGLGHAWSGGAPKTPYSDPRGPRASTLMWSFLSAQSRPSVPTKPSTRPSTRPPIRARREPGATREPRRTTVPRRPPSGSPWPGFIPWIRPQRPG